jgi:hypothetical protein
MTTQRSAGSVSKPLKAAASRSHMALSMAFSLPGRLSVTVAIGPARSTSTWSSMAVSSLIVWRVRGAL